MKYTLKNLMVSGLAAIVFAGPTPALAQQSSPESVTVRCDEGKSLQEAIDRAERGTTINVHGMCVENEVRVPGDMADLTIQGVAGTGAGITSTEDARNLIIHGRQIEIKGLRFTGGRGIQIDGGAATIIGNEFVDGAPTGIAIHATDGGVATILANVIRGFRRGGILSTNHAMVYVGVTHGGGQDPQPNLLDGTGTLRTGSAVKIRRTARGRVSGNCIRGYGQSGVRMDQHASAQVSGNVIAGSGSGGIYVTEVSVLALTQDSEPASIHNATNSHLLNGVRTPDGTQILPCANFEESASDNQPNNGVGIECGNTSVIRGRTDGMTVGATDSNLVVGETCFNALSAGGRGGPGRSRPGGPDGGRRGRPE